MRPGYFDALRSERQRENMKGRDRFVNGRRRVGAGYSQVRESGRLVKDKVAARALAPTCVAVPAGAGIFGPRNRSRPAPLMDYSRSSRLTLASPG